MEINSDSLLPKDPGGGEGFDNFARTLYVTPLLMERYFDIAEFVVDDLGARKWRALVAPNNISIWQRIKHWWLAWISDRDYLYETTVANARKAISNCE